MALMMGHLYIALRSVGVSEDLARAAAEEVACYQLNRAQRWPGHRFDLSMWVLTALMALNIIAVVVVGIILAMAGKP